MKENLVQTLSEKTPKIIAFYLPQFHPIPENDKWWGTGFTEWTNVTKAAPIFKEHYQPHLPADLGFYDLRLKEVRLAQAKLAHDYNIYGFCYHYYWFNGKKLLDLPLREVINSGEPDFPFCVCWANENWSRRWDGLDSEILIAQNHSDEDDANIILDLLSLFKDKRYIKVSGKPILVVYRVSLLPNPKKTAALWKKTAKEHGFEDLHLVAAQSFGITDPREYGFDAAVEFPPHGIPATKINDKILTTSNFKGNIYDYSSLIHSSISKTQYDYILYKTAVPSWDNTARKPINGSIYHGANPELYEFWLRELLVQSVSDKKLPEPIVFVNAWNEWAEGCHLEPDRKFGRKYLESTKRAQTSFLKWFKIRSLIYNAQNKNELERAITLADEFYNNIEKTLNYFILQKQNEIKIQLNNNNTNFKLTLIKQIKNQLTKYPKLKRFLKKALRWY